MIVFQRYLCKNKKSKRLRSGDKKLKRKRLAMALNMDSKSLPDSAFKQSLTCVEKVALYLRITD